MIITLCGSARFEEQFKDWNEKLTLAGHTVFSLSVYASDKKMQRMIDPTWNGSHEWYTEEQKTVLDQMHKEKIDLSEGIVVLNVDGYVGDSTASEIHHARRLGKSVFFLEGLDTRHLMVDTDVSMFGLAETLLKPRTLDIVFKEVDTPTTGGEGLIFVEIDFPPGYSTRIGEWEDGADGFRRLRISMTELAAIVRGQARL